MLRLEWWQLLLIIMGAGSLGAVIMAITAGGTRQKTETNQKREEYH